MATSSTHLQDGSIRKSRSTGDIPRVPDRVHLHSSHPPETLPNPHDAWRTSNNTSEIDNIQYASPNSNRPTSSSWNEPPRAQSAPSIPVFPEPTYQQPYPPATPTTSLRPPPRAPNPQEPPNNAANTQHNGSIYVRLLLYFGLGRHASRARKALISLIWTICWDSAQIIVIITLLILCGTFFKSPTSPQLTEWKACDRPLGAWASIWVVRVALALVLAIWEYQRDLILQPIRDDIELNGRPAFLAAQQNGTNINAQEQRPLQYNGSSNTIPVPFPPQLAHSTLFSRLTLLSSLLTLSWFLTAHILEYSSINTCRHSSPHLWWLVFGILCIMYLMILEVVLLGFVVLIITPILFIFWNIFLICMGRHTLQNPGMIKPEIKGIPKSVVERIPLVIYIPPPPEDENEKANEDGTHIPHVYPPKNPPAEQPQQKRFKLLRNFTSFKSKKGGGNETIDEKEGEATSKDDVDVEDQGPISWEDNWEKTDYPFVALEGNRAACAICLLDFEEPKRRHPAPTETETKPEETQESANTNLPSSSSSPIETQDATISEEHRHEKLRLEDAGEGPQPLRLLACGHVFHKTCLDPWLIDVSGRCPICQRPVEIPRPSKKARRRRRS